MPKRSLIIGLCFALTACTPLLGLDDLTFGDGSGGGDAGAPKPGAPLWAAALGDVGDDAARAIAVAGSDLLVAGCIGANGAGGQPATSGVCNTPATAFVARFDDAGHQKSLAHVAGSGDADALGVAPAPNGDVFVAGSYDGTLFDGTAHPLAQAATRLPYVARLNGGGAPVWTSVLDVLGRGQCEALLRDGSGLVISGYFNGSLKGLDPGTGDDAFYAVLDASGKLQRGARVRQQNPMTDTAYAIAVAIGPSGEVAIGGSFTGALGTENAPDTDGFVALYNAKDNATHIVVVNGTGTQIVTGLAFDKKGDLFVVGDYTAAAMFGSQALPTPGGPVDAFVGKLTAAGDVTWAYGFGGPGADDVRGVAVDEDDDAYLVGSASSGATLAGHSILNRGGADGYVAKLNPSGDVIWITALGGTTDDAVNAVALGPTTVYVTGTFTGSARIAGTDLTSLGGIDAFVAAFQR
jgi:hypothetical protein